MFVKEDRNWHEAAETCKVLGGRLTSIHNIQENTFITLARSKQKISIDDCVLFKINIFIGNRSPPNKRCLDRFERSGHRGFLPVARRIGGEL